MSVIIESGMVNVEVNGFARMHVRLRDVKAIYISEKGAYIDVGDGEESELKISQTDARQLISAMRSEVGS